MIYALIIVALAMGVVLALSPRGYTVHASVAGRLPMWIASARALPFWGFVRDDQGHVVDLKNKIVCIANKDSAEAKGIPHGKTVVASLLSAEEKKHLRRGTVVVVDGPAKWSKTGKRLRVIEAIGPDGIVSFQPSPSKPHRNRPVEEVIAEVTHVVS